MAQRVLGPQGAAAMTLFGEAVDAAEAERIGLVHRVVDDVVGAAVEMAGRAAAASRDLAIATKGTMRLTAGMAAQAAAVEVEVRAQAESVRSDEFKSRLAALQARSAEHGKPDVSRAELQPVRSGGAKRHSERARVNLARSTCTRPEE